MGKPTGFIEWPRAAPHRRKVDERLRDWREVETTADPAESKQQGGRCMDCGVPFCTQGCPLGNPIPDFAHAVYTDKWESAHRQLAVTNEFPEFTGRLCPAPCESACVLAIDNAPVTIEALERAISDRAFKEGWIQPRPPKTRTGKRVAIVGSGPAGLAAAAHINRFGHTAIVYEAAKRPGGLLRYGIPDFKMEKHVIDRRLEILSKEGVELRCGVAVGSRSGHGPTWKQLRADHDAVVIAIGAQRPRELDVPGRNLDGVVLAMDYLTEQNEVVGGERESTRFDVKGKRVIILGGGDTGSDCLGTAHRQGAAHVMQIELMPAPPATRATTNPWPTWAFVFRTSSSQEEGGVREFAFRTTRLEGKDGKLVALYGVKVEIKDGKLVDVPDSELKLEVDTLILALGFVGPSVDPLVEQLGIALDSRKNVIVDKQFSTNVKGVYCAGDAHRGASLIVWAIAEGRDMAKAVDIFLRGG
ncbi:MAG TPA: glutamate synthase subunit beta [Kofleriaceae bacterium]|nr:glutamate synthase subunit beta [Kofleriaceae bacterium]